jgi:hypothetical protein
MAAVQHADEDDGMPHRLPINVPKSLLGLPSKCADCEESSVRGEFAEPRSPDASEAPVKAVAAIYPGDG